MSSLLCLFACWNKKTCFFCHSLLISQIVLLLPLSTRVLKEYFSVMSLMKYTFRNDMVMSAWTIAWWHLLSEMCFFKVSEEDIVETFMWLWRRRVTNSYLGYISLYKTLFMFKITVPESHTFTTMCMELQCCKSIGYLYYLFANFLSRWHFFWSAPTLQLTLTSINKLRSKSSLLSQRWSYGNERQINPEKFANLNLIIITTVEKYRKYQNRTES